MKRIFKWLETKFSQQSADVEEEYSVSDDIIAQPKLSMRHKLSLDANESAGVDPYNSGSFDSSKSWKLVMRK